MADEDSKPEAGEDVPAVEEAAEGSQAPGAKADTGGGETESVDEQSSAAETGPSTPQISVETRQAYWAANLKILSVLLVIWFIVSYGCGILFVDELDKTRGPLPGFKLGFWFAQQGAIYVFVIIIFAYNMLMNKLDAKHGVAED
jgi:putative solute:sodium symporter small subunit